MTPRFTPGDRVRIALLARDGALETVTGTVRTVARSSIGPGAVALLAVGLDDGREEMCWAHQAVPLRADARPALTVIPGGAA